MVCHVNCARTRKKRTEEEEETKLWTSRRTLRAPIVKSFENRFWHPKEVVLLVTVTLTKCSVTTCISCDIVADFFGLDISRTQTIFFPNLLIFRQFVDSLVYPTTMLLNGSVVNHVTVLSSETHFVLKASIFIFITQNFINLTTNRHMFRPEWFLVSLLLKKW